MLAGCEKSDEQCLSIKMLTTVQLQTQAKARMYHRVQQCAERSRTYCAEIATREDCVAEFGEGQCQQAPARLAWHQKTRRRPSNPAGVSDAADGRLHDGTSDGRRRGI